MLSPSPRGSAMHNLAAHLPLLIGREVELEQLPLLLHDSRARLLTLTGPGGCGKTRLALELAHRALASFAGGVWFVDLATLAEPALVPQAVAAIFGIREEPGLPLVDTFIATLGGRSLLLVLDNCEHLIESCATLCERLLSACPELRIRCPPKIGRCRSQYRGVSPMRQGHSTSHDEWTR